MPNHLSWLFEEAFRAENKRIKTEVRKCSHAKEILAKHEINKWQSRIVVLTTINTQNKVNLNKGIINHHTQELICSNKHSKRNSEEEETKRVIVK